MSMRETLSVLLIAATLIACQKEVPNDNTGKRAPSSPTASSKPTSPERIAEIESTGKTGLWATSPEVCMKEVGKGLRTMLVWNVKDQGASRVVVYVISNAGEEHHFGQGGPVGEKESGPWLRPGLVFMIRDYDSKEALGSVTIMEKPC